MTNFTETASFDPVTRLETTTAVQGGSGGASNNPLQQLVNRTAFLNSLINTSLYQGAWVSSTIYKINQIVQYSSNFYLSLTASNQANIPSGSSIYWLLLGQQGPAGTAAQIAGVSATSLPAGSVPTVANTGSTLDANLVFGIPSGPTGATGAVGNVITTGASLQYPALSTLRSTSGLSTNNQLLVLLGHGAPNDGGGGLFYLDTSDTTSADNNGTVIVVSGSNNIRAKRIQNNDLDVAWFGAKGDDSNDDTSAIQAAVNALPSTGGRIRLGVGKFKTTGTITCTKPVDFVGLSSGTYRKYSSLINNGVTQINCTVNNIPAIDMQTHNFRIKDMRINYSGGTTPVAGSAGIKVTSGGSSSFVERNCITGFYINIDWQNGAEWAINNNHLYAPIKGCIRINDLVEVDAGDQSIQGNWFYAGPLAFPDYGVLVQTGGGVKFVNNKFNSDVTVSTGNKLGTGILIQLPAAGETKVDGTTFASQVITSTGTITGNSFENIAGDAIFFDSRTSGSYRYSLTAIAGNEFAFLGGYAIVLNGASSCSITGNTSSSCKGLYLKNCFDISVGVNTWTRMPTLQPVVTIDDGCTNCVVQEQNASSVGQLYRVFNKQESFITSTTSIIDLRNRVDHTYRTTLQNNTGGFTYFPLWTLWLPLFGGASIELELAGYLLKQGDASSGAAFWGNFKRAFAGTNSFNVVLNSKSIISGTDQAIIRENAATISAGTPDQVSEVLATASYSGKVSGIGVKFSFATADTNNQFQRCIISVAVASTDTWVHDSIYGTADLKLTGLVSRVYEGSYTGTT